MNRNKSEARKSRLTLEGLETRITPATISPLGAWANGLRGAAIAVAGPNSQIVPTVGAATPNDVGLTPGSITPNIPAGGTTDPSTPGLPNTVNPNFPFRTTYLRAGGATTGSGTIGSGTTGGGLVNTGNGGGSFAAPGVNVPRTTTRPSGSPFLGNNGFQGNNILRPGFRPNIPTGGTTDPSTPGLPGNVNPNFPFRTTFLRSGSTTGGGFVNTGNGGGSFTTPGIGVPRTTTLFNNSFLRTGNISTGVTTPGVAVPTVNTGNTGISGGDLTTPGVPTPSITTNPTSTGFIF